jgi:hypothetical protein
MKRLESHARKAKRAMASETVNAMSIEAEMKANMTELLSAEVQEHHACHVVSH